MQTPVHSKPPTSSSLTPSAHSLTTLCSSVPQRAVSCINSDMGITLGTNVAASQLPTPWPPLSPSLLAPASLWTRGLFPAMWHLWTSVAQAIHWTSPSSGMKPYLFQWDLKPSFGERIPFPSVSIFPLVISLSPRIPFRVHSAFL